MIVARRFVEVIVSAGMLVGLFWLRPAARKGRRDGPMPGRMILKPLGRPGNASTQTRRSTYRFTTDHNEPPTVAGSRNTFSLKPRAAPSFS